MMTAVRAQDVSRKTFSVVIGLRSLVDHVGYDDHVDFDEMNETVKVHDDA